MNTTNTTVIAGPRGPQWLLSAYDYIGAHKNTLRADHERERAIQRLATPVFVIVWDSAFHSYRGRTFDEVASLFVLILFAYAIASAAFWGWLVRNPRGGVHAQYGFFVIDPLLIGTGLWAIPQQTALLQVLMVITVVRVGFRYGLNAMRVVLGLSWAGALIPMLSGSLAESNLQTSALLPFLLGWMWWLFSPVIRATDKAKQLEIDREVERAKLLQMQEALKDKSVFLSRVSHELRSPLQRVVSALDVFESRFSSDASAAELVRRVRSGATALNTQLRDLLTVARGDVGKLEVQPVPFDARELCLSVQEQLQSMAIGKGLRFRVVLPPGPVFVVADPERIGQVLRNLISNAVRHTKQGEVRLTLTAEGTPVQTLVFKVSDNGPGIAAEQLSAIFEPFSRFGPLARSDDGAGLGLAVVGTIMQFLGGRITVASEPDGGAQFTAEVPVEAVDRQEVAGMQNVTDDRVLVVDERPDVRRAVAAVAASLGWECTAYESAPHAANALGARRYGLVVIGLKLTVKSGTELAWDLKRGSGPNAHSTLLAVGEVTEGSAPIPPFDESTSLASLPSRLRELTVRREHRATALK